LNTTIQPAAVSHSRSVRSITLQVDELAAFCRELRDRNGRLVSLWASERLAAGQHSFVLSVALQDTQGLQVAEVVLDAARPEYPDLRAIFPVADRLQRAAHDLVGVTAVGGDARPWLRYAAWPAEAFPLRHDVIADHALVRDDYAFVRVAGDGVHEIPVGPVHAGII